MDWTAPPLFPPPPSPSPPWTSPPPSSPLTPPSTPPYEPSPPPSTPGSDSTSPPPSSSYDTHLRDSSECTQKPHDERIVYIDEVGNRVRIGDAEKFINELDNEAHDIVALQNNGRLYCMHRSYISRLHEGGYKSIDLSPEEDSDDLVLKQTLPWPSPKDMRKLFRDEEEDPGDEDLRRRRRTARVAQMHEAETERMLRAEQLQETPRGWVTVERPYPHGAMSLDAFLAEHCSKPYVISMTDWDKVRADYDDDARLEDELVRLTWHSADDLTVHTACYAIPDLVTFWSTEGGRTRTAQGTLGAVKLPELREPIAWSVLEQLLTATQLGTVLGPYALLAFVNEYPLEADLLEYFPLSPELRATAERMGIAPPMGGMERRLLYENCLQLATAPVWKWFASALVEPELFGDDRLDPSTYYRIATYGFADEDAFKKLTGNGPDALLYDVSPERWADRVVAVFKYLIDDDFVSERRDLSFSVLEEVAINQLKDLATTWESNPSGRMSLGVFNHRLMLAVEFLDEIIHPRRTVPRRTVPRDPPSTVEEVLDELLHRHRTVPRDFPSNVEELNDIIRRLFEGGLSFYDRPIDNRTVRVFAKRQSDTVGWLRLFAQDTDMHCATPGAEIFDIVYVPWYKDVFSIIDVLDVFQRARIRGARDLRQEWANKVMEFGVTDWDVRGFRRNFAKLFDMLNR